MLRRACRSCVQFTWRVPAFYKGWIVVMLLLGGGWLYVQHRFAEQDEKISRAEDVFNRQQAEQARQLAVIRQIDAVYRTGVAPSP